MNIDKLPDFQPLDFGSVIDARRPILSYHWQGDGPHRAAAHSHPRAQIIYPSRGTYWVTTPQGNWLVPAKQALWIPPYVHHEVYSHDSVTAFLLFVDNTHAKSLPKVCMTVQVSPLLHELLKKGIAYGNDYAPDGAAARLSKVILDELGEMKTAPFFLPMSRDKRLQRLMSALLADPADERTLDSLARDSGASPRTLARLFRRDTGMTFPQWKGQLRLIQAIDRLSQGNSVSEVAFDLGYSSASAFIYMFRSRLSMTPGEYLRTHVASD